MNTHEVEISIGKCVTKWRRNIKLRICDFKSSAMERNFMKLKEIIKVDGNPFADTEFSQLECVEVNGKLYFPASECAKVLGYHNPRKAIIDHCDEPIKLTVLMRK